MRPRKLTPEIEARLEAIAIMRLAMVSYAKLARETGLSANYLRHVVSEKMLALSHKRAVSRGA